MEKLLWKQIRDKLPGFFIQRIETQIERGIPDVHYVTYGGHTGWIEGKYLEIRKKNLHKMKSIPVCKFDGKASLETD